MALPLVLLTIALAGSYLMGWGRRLVHRELPDVLSLVLLAVAVGSLFVTNSWDFPTYFLVIAAVIVVRAYLEDGSKSWWRGPIFGIVALGIVSLIAYAPFYLHFKSLSSGIGLVSSSTDPYEFLQIFGLFIVGGVLLASSLYLLLQPEAEIAEVELDPLAEAGQAKTSAVDRLLLIAAVAAVLIAASIAHRLTLVCLIGLGAAAIFVLYRVLNTEEPNRSDAFALILLAAGCLAAAIPEVVYLRDIFAGGTGYRMNTVFKFYYQAWVLLAIAGSYGIYRASSILRTLFNRATMIGALALVAILTLGAGIYTARVPEAHVNQASPATLNGAAWLAASNPGDAKGIAWFQAHAAPNSVVLEAKADDYSSNGTLFSTFAGMSDVLGWSGHEDQWRPGDAEVEQRIADIKTIYTTHDAGMARQLLQKYNVKYVVVGEQEVAAYGPSSPGLQKFSHFMRIAYSVSGITIYTW
jgi:YYY domain-containing protein